MERQKPLIGKFGVNGVEIRLNEVCIDDPVVKGVVRLLRGLDGARYTTSEVLITREPRGKRDRDNLNMAGYALVRDDSLKARIALFSSRIHEDSLALGRDPALTAMILLRHELGHALHSNQRAMGLRFDEFEVRTGEDMLSDRDLEVVADSLWGRLK